METSEGPDKPKTLQAVAEAPVAMHPDLWRKLRDDQLQRHLQNSQAHYARPSNTDTQLMRAEEQPAAGMRGGATARPPEQPPSQLTALADFFASVSHLPAAAVSERIREAGPELLTLLTDAAKIASMETQLQGKLTWIPPFRLLELVATVAKATGRDNAHELALMSQRPRQGVSAQGADAALMPNGGREQLQSVIDFFATNAGLLSRDIRANLRDADAQLKALLREHVGMRAMDTQISEKLCAISPTLVADMHAIIADELGYPTLAPHAARAAPRPSEDEGDAESSSPSAPGQRTQDGSRATERNGTGLNAAPAPPVKPGAQQPFVTMDAVAASKNGFAPADGGGRSVPIAPVGDLLERMKYRSMSDGSVLYSLDGSPAFIDHGDQLLMVGSADAHEQAILGAILLANEKYRGSFEITGTEEFMRRAVGIMLKYGIEAKLNNPEQEAVRRAMAREAMQSAYQPASPQRPVVPVDPPTLVPAESAGATLHAEAPIEPATPPSEDRPPVAETGPASDRAGEVPHGTVLEMGSAPYQHVRGNNQSFYVTLQDADGASHTTWGIDLERATKDARVKVGDQVTLLDRGKKSVDVERPVFDTKGNFMGTGPAASRKVQWQVSIIAKGPARTNGTGTVPRPSETQAAQRSGEQRGSQRQGALPSQAPTYSPAPAPQQKQRRPRPTSSRG